VGLGSDSVASNNTMDMFEEMRFAVLLQRARTRKYEAMTARQAVELATIHGARAMGLESQIGSLEPGKQADLAVWRIDGLEYAGIADPVAALVLGPLPPLALLLVGGRTVVEDGELRTLSTVDAATALQEASRRLEVAG
jgi:cytosine/adenosine deaminase-related metal-dependent hydrolase